MAILALIVTQWVLPLSGYNDVFPLFNWSIFSFSIPKTQTTTIRVTFKDNTGEHICYLPLCPRELMAGNRKELIWRVNNWEKNTGKSLNKPEFFTGLDERIIRYEILRVETDHTKAFSSESTTPLKVLGDWRN